MNIKEVKLHQLMMNMKHPFTTSFGTQQDRFITIIEAVDENGLSGFGECVAGEDPLYSEEFMDASVTAMKIYVATLLLQNEIKHPDDVWELFMPFKRNNMAKAAIEGAVWYLYAKRHDMPRSKRLGGVKDNVDGGVL